MSIPTSLIVVLLVVAWLVVLVPMIAKRRDKVPRSQSGGNGFRVLRRAQATLKRRPKRVTKTEDATPDAGAPAAPPPATRERTLVSVGAPAPDEPWTPPRSGRPRTPATAPAPRPEGPVESDDTAFEQPAEQWEEPAGMEPAPEYREPAADARPGHPVGPAA